MEEHPVRIVDIAQVTHDVRRFRVEKPAGYAFTPGQATEVAINQAQWRDERRPFTFTSLNEWEFLEFTIKIYRDHPGVTNQLGTLSPGDELLLHDVWGAIAYAGPGVFIAGGAGVTPFIAILRQLQKDSRIEGHTLIFSNKTEKDIILRAEFEAMLGPHFYNTITHEQVPGFDHRLIDQAFLMDMIADFSQHFYVCGPDLFTSSITSALTELGAKPEALVFEK
jgi:ferredoxin-NADP reductase